MSVGGKSVSYKNVIYLVNRKTMEKITQNVTAFSSFLGFSFFLDVWTKAQILSRQNNSLPKFEKDCG